MKNQEQMDRFYALAAERDGLEVAAKVILNRLTAVNAELDLVSAAVTRDLPEEPAQIQGELIQEEEIAAGIDYREEQYPHLADLMVA